MTTFQIVVFFILMTYHLILLMVYLSVLRNLKQSLLILKQFGFGLFEFCLELFIVAVTFTIGILTITNVVPLFIFIICTIVGLLYYISFDVVHKINSKFRMFFNVATVIALIFFLKTLPF